jgi:flagellar hook-associated protein FlgK
MSGINGLFSTAFSGLNAAGAVINNAASNIANMETPDYKAGRVQLASAPGGDGVEVAGVTHGGDEDPASDLVSLRLGQTLYQANAAVIRVGDQLTGTLLDMFDTHRRSD